MIEFFSNNYQWIFSGIGVVVLVFIANKIFSTDKTKNDTNTQNSNTVNITNNVNGKNEDFNEENSTAISGLKAKTRILFVDDEHTKFKMVSILKKSGWKNTKSIKDITDLDDLKVQDADIIFVDINGVGKTLFEDQGLGLASALKKKYPDKKIVIYSSETKGDRFHRALREVDDCLAKDAEPYQFSNLIETLCQ